MIVQHIERASGYGYNYRTSQVSRYGLRPIGEEVHCVMDDFGNLIVVGPWRVCTELQSIPDNFFITGVAQMSIAS